MKISEFINILEEIEELNGDIDIFYRRNGVRYVPEFTHLMANVNNGERWVVIE
ncbi:MAG: hypothetical protein Q8M92_01170 [Candidatus Subteraquimicrobiales bacterium]|nr:hypothetical protein [Candidatus Subteraquimicrobiales bacterium]